MKLDFCKATLLMDSMTDPVTSGSELEEGEIEEADNSEIEIISENIVRGPGSGFKNMGVVAVGSPVRKRNDLEDGVIDIKSKRRKPSFESTPDMPFKLQEPVLPSYKPQRPVNNNRRSPKHYQSRNHNKNIGNSRRPAELRKKETPRSPSQIYGNAQSNGLDSAPPTLSKTEDVREVKDGKRSPTLERLQDRDVDWDDEETELKLRLAALESVVMKAVRNEEDPDKRPGTQVDDKSEKVDVEEEEDEEVLRALLLIEVAKKQTQEMELQTRVEPPYTANPTKDTSRQPAVTSGPILKRKFNPPIPIQPTERLIIDLRDDSSDSSDDEHNVEDSISALIKSARLTVDQKTKIATSAVSALPLHEQEEYHRLKSELERRANKSSTMTVQKPQDRLRKVVLNSAATVAPQILQDGNPTVTIAALNPLKVLQATDAKTSKVAVQTSQDESLNTETLTASTTAGEKLLAIPTDTESPKRTIQSMPITNECSATKPPEHKAEKELEAREIHAVVEMPSESLITKGALPTEATPAGDSLPKPSVKADGSEKLKTNAENLQAKKVATLKHQLLQKKNATKDALKSQLELVEKNRALLERSSQEVARLKALLQSAEETERQFRLQLNTSQSKLQNLSKKMLIIEKELNAQHNGVSPTRTKRLNQKLRVKAVHTAMSVINHSPSQFRVKPTVLVKALTNKSIAHSHQQKTVSRDMKAPDLSNVLTRTHEESEKNKGKYDGWLYGTLGDDATESTGSSFPVWTSNEHASKTVGNPLVNPWNMICLKSLGGTCQGKHCTFEHLARDVIAVEVTEDPNVFRRFDNLALLQFEFAASRGVD